MAIRRTNKKDNSKISRAIIIFWIVFIVIIICVFAANSQTIFRNFNILLTGNKPSQNTNDGIFINGEAEHEVISPKETRPAVIITVETPIENEQPGQTINTTEPPVNVQTPEPVKPVEQPAQTNQQQIQPPPQPPQPTPMQTRAIYFAQVDRDGQIRQSRVTRSLPASNTPMRDALNAMLTGPSSTELNGNLLSFIPQNTRLLSATIQGTTAYVNFSENFLFNTYGVEGYVAQLKQIVWTVTEFQNVNDVQILIEGQRRDYLAEGIYIGAPIRRESF
ncbi:MAG: GerMN domain-containing protein [Treponema sp.]|nr:GerMN domain-containing protein [Treponema sp.]